MPTDGRTGRRSFADKDFIDGLPPSSVPWSRTQEVKLLTRRRGGHIPKHTGDVSGDAPPLSRTSEASRSMPTPRPSTRRYVVVAPCPVSRARPPEGGWVHGIPALGDGHGQEAGGGRRATQYASLRAIYSSLCPSILGSWPLLVMSGRDLGYSVQDRQGRYPLSIVSAALHVHASPVPADERCGAPHPLPQCLPAAPSRWRTRLPSQAGPCGLTRPLASPWVGAGARWAGASACSPRGARTKRRLRRSRCARPNMCRLSIFNRLMWPSTGPLLQGTVTRLGPPHSRHALLAQNAARPPPHWSWRAPASHRGGRAGGCARGPRKSRASVTASARSACWADNCASWCSSSGRRVSGRRSTSQAAPRG